MYIPVVINGIGAMDSIIALKQDAIDTFDFFKLLFVSNHPHVDDEGDHLSHEKEGCCTICCCSSPSDHKSNSNKLGSDRSDKDHPGHHELKSTRCVAITLFILFSVPSIGFFFGAVSSAGGALSDPNDSPEGYKRVRDFQMMSCRLPAPLKSGLLTISPRTTIAALLAEVVIHKPPS